MKFYTLYDLPPQVSFETVGESLTQQSFKDDCDINILLTRFQEQPRPGVLSVSGPRVPMWGDFSHVPTVREAHDVFQRAETSFHSLPADLRARFNNNPVEMLAFLESASHDDIKAVFGDKAPVSNESNVIDKVEGVSSVNQETVARAQ